MRRIRVIVAGWSVPALVTAWACGASTGLPITAEVGPDGATLDSSRPTGDAFDDSAADDRSEDSPALDARASDGDVESGTDARPDGGDGEVVDRTPSCAAGGPGMTDCGASRESCCTTLDVVGGSYFRTYSNTGAGPTGEAAPAQVSGFRLDKYLVTVGRFRQFVAAWDAGVGYLPRAGTGKHTHLNGGQGLANVADAGGAFEPGWSVADDVRIAPDDDNLTCSPRVNEATWTPAPGANETLPINCVNWWESFAFCIWDGGFLPSESEWEYAAAGGDEEREFPWGSEPPDLGNQHAICNCDYPDGSGTCAGGLNVAPVGAAELGGGRWNQLDLAGDLFEWNVDSFGDYVTPCIDCAHLTSATNRITRGGNFASAPPQLAPAARLADATSDRSFYLGFRCARTP